MSKPANHLYLVTFAQMACLAAGLWMQHYFVVSAAHAKAVEQTRMEMDEDADYVLSRLGDIVTANTADTQGDFEQFQELLGSSNPRVGAVCIVDGSWKVLFAQPNARENVGGSVAVGSRLVWTPAEEPIVDATRHVRGTFETPHGPHIAVGQGINGRGGYLLIHCPRAAVEAKTSALLSSLPGISAVTLLWTSVLLSISTYMVLSLVHERAERERVRSSTVGLQLRRVKDQAATDPLTGLRNRAYLEKQFEPLFQQQVVRNAELAAVMLDVDNFKTYNDMHGHQAGDALLRSIGALLRGSIRPSDVGVRYGGDEFLLLLPGANAEQAAMIAGRIIKHFGEKIGCLGQKVSVSMSAGVASLQRDACESGQALVKQADVALYAAKRSGKNMVSTSPPPCQPSTKPLPVPAAV